MRLSSMYTDGAFQPHEEDNTLRSPDVTWPQAVIHSQSSNSVLDMQIFSTVMWHSREHHAAIHGDDPSVGSKVIYMQVNVC